MIDGRSDRRAHVRGWIEPVVSHRRQPADQHASQIDANGDDDGTVEFQFDVVPTATLHNETDLGFNIGARISLLSVELGYDIEMASDSTTLGPLAEFGGTLPVGDINVFNSTFGPQLRP